MQRALSAACKKGNGSNCNGFACLSKCQSAGYAVNMTAKTYLVLPFPTEMLTAALALSKGYTSF